MSENNKNIRTNISNVTQNANALASFTDNDKAQKVTQQINQVIDISQQITRKANQVSDVWQSASMSEAINQLLGLSSRPTGLQFTLEVLNLPKTSFSVIAFHLEEHYSQPYCLTLQLSSTNPAISSTDVLDQLADFKVWQQAELLRQLNGVVTRFTQGESGFARTHYEMEIRPRLWHMHLRHNSRIFQLKNIQQILTALLEEHGIVHYAFAFQQPHPERAFCVQYQETDFAFLQRLTAEEGIFYYFEQEAGLHRVVFADSAVALKEQYAFPYNPNRQAQLQQKSVTRFIYHEQVRPNQTTLRDYTFKNPNWQAEFQQEQERTQRNYEHYDYPGRFKDSAHGKAFSQYRLESLRRNAQYADGESNIPQLTVGSLLHLTAHPNAQFNRYWQLVSLQMQGEQPQSSEGEAGEKGTYLVNHFQVVDKNLTWRPLQRHKPKVDGPQMAIVVGPAGEEIFTDNFGRVRVQFLWDREGHYDDHSSCWIRVTQPWAGQGWGMLAIPRVGQEVMVDFLDGDPDQPIITGRAYHALNIPPGNLPVSKTQMAIRSKTYKGEGYNEILFEDAPNQERLDLHAQRDMNTTVLNNKSTQVNHRHIEQINRNQTLNIAQERQKSILKTEMLSVLGNLTTEVAKSSTQQIKKDLVISSQQGTITFAVGKSLIQLTQDGSLTIQSDLVKVDGEKIFVNRNKISTSNSNVTQSNNLYSPQESDLLETGSLVASQENISLLELTAVNHQSKGLMTAQSKLLTSNALHQPKGFSVKLAAVDINMENNKSNIGFSVFSGAIETTSDINKLEAGVSAISLNGKYQAGIGAIEADMKIFSADANINAVIYSGENSIWGFDVGATAQASAISVEIRSCIGTEEDWFMICAKFGVNSGPSMEGKAKIIWDNKKEIFDIGGKIGALGNVSIDAKINLNKFK